MISQRKRFNYMPQFGKSQLIKKSQVHQQQYKENIYDKKIEQLENANKRILHETTKQFKKLEADVKRVENILIDKQNQIEITIKDKNQLIRQKGTLIEAIKEKDQVIQQYETKVKELLDQPKLQNQFVQTIEFNQTYTSEVQTDIQAEKIVEEDYKEKYQKLLKRAMEMEDEVYQLKQQLFDAQGQLNVVQQQFSTYKILKDIQEVQKQQ